MNKWLEILVGLILVIVAVLIGFGLVLPEYTATWKEATWVVLKGGIIWGVFLIGLLFLMLGISDIKS